MDGGIQPIPREDYERLIEFLQDYNPPAILPIQIAYYTGLRIGEACGLAWQDVNLEEQCLTIRRSIRYDGSRHKNMLGILKVWIVGINLNAGNGCCILKISLECPLQSRKLFLDTGIQ